MDWKKVKENAWMFFTIDREGQFDLADLGKAWRKLWIFLQIVLRTANGFAKNRQGFQAITLSYNGLMAFVPLVAFVFAITGGLGFADEALWHYLLHKITFLSDKSELTDSIIDFAMTIVNLARSGWVGLISALVFSWTIIWLFFQIENVFNIVWKANGKRDRNIWKRFGWFIGMLFLLPFVLLIFGSSFVLYTNAFKWINLDLGPVGKLVPWIGITVMSIITFTLMFKYIPEVRVKFKYALYSSIVTAVCFSVFQYLYLETQMFVTRLNSVYGVMAAIPLFLIWMNFSWQIILYGANLVKALQDFNEGEEYAFKKGE